MKKGDVATTKILADLCADHLNIEYREAFRLYETPLSFAIKANSQEMVRILVEAGANPDTTTQNDFRHYETPLSLAVKARSPEIVQILLNAGADPNKKTQFGFQLYLSPLEIAIEEGYTEMFNILTGTSS